MGRRGPPPQPTALRVLRGNPGQRRYNPREPQHPPLAEACPDALTDPVARAEWDRIAPMLITRGQVTTVDRATLMGYCLKWAQWLALEVEAATHPAIVRSPTGNPIQNPAMVLANKTFLAMMKAAGELGITPASRSRVIASEPTKGVENKWAGILK